MEGLCLPGSNCAIMDSMRRWIFVFLLLICGVLVLVSADAGSKIQEADLDLSNTDSLKELKHLKSQLESLAATLKAKDSSLQDKENRISFLESRLESIQGKGCGEVEETLIAAQERENRFKTQVEKLEHDVNELNIQSQTFKKHAESSEATVIELMSKKLQAMQTIEQQQGKIHSAEKALQKAEAVFQQAVSEAENKAKELLKATEAWLPPWLAVSLQRGQELAILEWVEHGQPVVISLSDQAYQISASAHKLAKPHFENVKEKWVPLLQQHWENVAVVVDPYFNTVKAKAGEGIESAKISLAPHVTRAQKTLIVYTELVRDKSSPYIEEAAILVQPYFESARSVLGPHLEKADCTYQKLLKLTTAYHLQATALLLLPVLGILLMFSSTFGGKKSSKSDLSSDAGASHKKKRSKQVYK